MPKGLFDLTGKRALITGSGRGLGYTLARGLGRAGAVVVLNDIDASLLRKAVAALRREGIDASGTVFDVRDAGAIAKGIRAIEKKQGGIDILVNNAGIQIRASLEEFDEEAWRRLIDINLTGVFLVSKAVVKGMITRKSGKIINIGSVQCELARPTIAPYTAAKGGVKNLTRGMATDWGKYNIQVNSIAPGYLKTEMTQALYDDPKFNAWLCGRTPANRWGDPEDLVGAAVFLSSRASNYVSGQIVFVDGGLTSCV
ncbi:MAG: SDR family oxidoreductase [Chitinispirillaceae bacterium]|nr:SDR family oxidoreductase [Chitinispirillaceae bacterium]